jgi:hypothetical protein
MIKFKGSENRKERESFFHLSINSIKNQIREKQKERKEHLSNEQRR